MSYRKLYIFVEGNDDELFFKRAMFPMLLEHYTEVEVFKYAQWKRAKVEMFLQSIITLGYEYVFTADIDQMPSVNEKKRWVRGRFNGLDLGHIMIVIKEIESWYLAGCTDAMAAVLGINLPQTTNEITKEDFNEIAHHSRHHSHLDFMIELMKHFSHQTALKRNQSYKFFAERLGIAETEAKIS